MTAAQFRRLALGLPEAVESSHFSHPDFRVRNRVFATLGYPDPRYGMVRLTPEQQKELVRAAPESFRPAAGAWGRSGSTIVLLSAIDVAALRPILQKAWENVAAKTWRERSAADGTPATKPKSSGVRQSHPMKEQCAADRDSADRRVSASVIRGPVTPLAQTAERVA